MGISSGDKKVEAGILPDDWVDLCVGDVVKFEGGAQPERSTFISSLKPGFIRLIQIRDYKTDNYATYIPEHLARRFCTEFDIMIGRYGPPVFQILRGLRGSYNVALIKATPRLGITRSYVYHFLKQKKVYRFIEKLSQRSSGQTGVDLAELRGYPFPLPATKAEQDAIANALNDVDALIESLERLIAKKRQLKQGVMQELLTGRRRLPGFETKPGYKKTALGVIPEDWTVKPLRGLATIIHGFAFQSQYFATQGVYRLTTPGHFQEIGGFREVGDKQRYYNGPLPEGCLLDKSDLIVAMTEQADGLLGSAALVPASATYLHNQRLGKAKIISPALSVRYLYYVFNFEDYRSKVRETATGMKVKHTSPSKLLRIPVRLPPTRAEQEAIAEVLNDADLLIESIGAKLSKTRQLKQRMMQELLTGKIRLV